MNDLFIFDCWPPGSCFEGLMLSEVGEHTCFDPDHFEISPAEAELLLRLLRRCPSLYAHRMSRNLTTALEEWLRMQGQDDL